MNQQQDTTIEQPKREWIKPEVRRIVAGEAEGALNNGTPDGNVFS